VSMTSGDALKGHVILLTFDNLGEASELERGTWPEGEPLGRHPSVTRALPRLLDELERHALSATFFVEGLNCELYPDAVRGIAARGHDIGAHGWRHEPWGELPSDRAAERALLTRATDAFRRLGVTPRGFRPPSGSDTDQTHGILAELDYTWCSIAAADDDASARARRAGGLWDVTYDWGLVDAYSLMPRFAELRRRRGDPAEPMAPQDLGDRLAARLPQEVGTGLDVIILHPFLMLDDAWWEQVQRLLALLAGLRGSGRASVLSPDTFIAGLAGSGSAS
jgi:peptidoglycan/xylan/chitin deacetylase (PgdA/CDA1 family)